MDVTLAPPNPRRALLALSLGAGLLLSGCSLVRSSGDFTVIDAGPPGGEPCVTAADCTVGPHALAECVAGRCAPAGCEDGYADCNGAAADGCEAETDTSLTHCGGCGMACNLANAVGACEAGACTLSGCMAGFEDCDSDATNGCEADLASATSCGACDVACASGELCDSTGASPVCSATCAGTVCGGSCVDTTSSVSHCGGCDMACGTAQVVSTTCESSACEVQECAAGFGDCDGDGRNGCEASLLDDPFHCGGCGVVCSPGTACVAGVCDPAIDVAGSIGHTCVIRQSGQLWCWGRNRHAQSAPDLLPRSPEEAVMVRESLSPGAPPLLVRAVSAGANQTCVIGLDGRLRCWGFGPQGQLGIDPPPALREAEPQLVTSADAAFAARSFVAVATSDAHTCALDDLGGVWCWGQNTRGQTGRPTSEATTNQATRVPLPMSATDVATSNAASCAVLTDGTVRCWGDNQYGTLGDGTTTSSHVPVTVMGVSDAREILREYRTFCTIGTGGSLRCWGYNTAGALGTRVPVDYETVPVTREPSGVLEAWMVNYALCWRMSDGVRCAGNNRNGQFGDGLRAPLTQNGDPPIRVPGLDAMRTVHSGLGHACGIQDGRVYCWGRSGEGQILRPTLYAESAVTVVDQAGVAPTDFTEVSFGFNHGCGIRLGALYCWGSSEWNKAGQPSAESYASAVSGLLGVQHVSAGRDGTCVIVDAGPPDGRQVLCWGQNNRGQTGGPTANTTEPTLVDIPGGEEIAVAIDDNHTCAIQESAAGSGQGSVYCWGANDSGQLGRDTGGADGAPGLVSGITDATQLGVGRDFTCALRAGGTVVCWGANTTGQLGDGTTTPHTSPAPVTGLTGVTALAVGFRHACALRAGGAVACWGSGGGGQLGDGSTGVNATTPVVVSTTGFSARATSVAAGETHSCASYDDGNTRCWGANTFSAVGGTDYGSIVTPQVVGGVTDATSVTTGSTSAHTTCALQTNGSVACWGADDLGATGGGHPLYFAPTLMDLP